MEVEEFSTQVADNRSNPPVRSSFPAGQTLDENALRQVSAAQTSLVSGTFATGRWSGTGKFTYWLEPGDYSLTATFTTGTGPKRVQVATEPVQLKVVNGKRNSQIQP